MRASRPDGTRGDSRDRSRRCARRTCRADHGARRGGAGPEAARPERAGQVSLGSWADGVRQAVRIVAPARCGDWHRCGAATGPALLPASPGNALGAARTGEGTRARTAPDTRIGFQAFTTRLPGRLSPRAARRRADRWRGLARTRTGGGSAEAQRGSTGNACAPLVTVVHRLRSRRRPTGASESSVTSRPSWPRGMRLSTDFIGNLLSGPSRNAIAEFRPRRATPRVARCLEPAVEVVPPHREDGEDGEGDQGPSAEDDEYPPAVACVRSASFGVH